MSNSSNTNQHAARQATQSAIPQTTQHTNFQSLPIIDISGLYSEQFEIRQHTAQQLGQAAKDAGFLYITGHSIPPKITQQLIDTTTAYFAQPTEQKMQDYIGNSSNHSGYVPVGEEQFVSGKYDLKEAYDVGYDYLLEHGRRPMLGANKWPSFPNFKQDISAYYQEAFALGNILFKGFALALGLDENFFSTLVTTPPSQLRLIHYPYNPEAQDKEGIGAHTDYECFTILLPTKDGLEVMNGAGEWINAPVVEGTLVVNIGDMLETLSNGLFMATSHRVRKVKEERYSFPLFCSCDYDTLIEPIATLKSNRSDKQYEAIRCGDHLYAQTIQIFTYLKNRVASGALKLPDNAKPLASFGNLKQSV
jgi:isopenicillin N synthase-like dioxygenase